MSECNNCNGFGEIFVKGQVDGTCKTCDGTGYEKQPSNSDLHVHSPEFLRET